MPEHRIRNTGGAPDQRDRIQTVLGYLCIILLAGILYAGLTPFRAPANQVAWVADVKAVRFGEYGTILSSGSVPPPGPGPVARSLEIWIQPGQVKDSNTLVAFYAPGQPRQLSICQADSDLEIRIQSSAAWRTVRTEKINIADAFRDGRSAFWTVVFGPSGTTIYRDGLLIRRSSITPLRSEIAGRLVVGNSPIFNDSWSGVLRGLAIYDTALDGAQVARHCLSWTGDLAPVIKSNDACVALFLFDEHTGRVVHNTIRSGNDLYIPPKYMVVRQTVLDPVWRAFDWSRGFWKDAIINIAGFIPFGCFFCAYFRVRGFRRPAFSAAAIGGVVSAFIELTQTQLPTRDSSMSDLINNILGSILGALAYRGVVAQAIHRAIFWIISA